MAGGASDPARAVLPQIRVVEIAAGVAVAYCAQLLGQLGAEVIRIEPPEGDAIRRSGPSATIGRISMAAGSTTSSRRQAQRLRSPSTTKRAPASLRG